MSILTLQVLSIILIIGFATFYFANKAFANHIPKNDYKYWVYSWGIITILGFVSGKFFLFCGLSAAVTYYMSKRVTNRVAYFLVLFFVFPPYPIYTPIIYMTHQRLLALVILLPMFLSKKWRLNTPSLGRPLGDKLIISLLILMFLLNLRGTTVGDSLRTSITVFVDWFLPYFVISRCLKNYSDLKTAILAFSITCTIAALVALYEHLAFWPLYNFIPGLLNMDSINVGWLLRDGQLRAGSSVGHALSLGFVLVVAIGLNLFVSFLTESKLFRAGFFTSLLAGLYASISRGPMGAAGIILTFYAVTGKNAISRLILITIAFVIAVNILPSIPGGQKIINLIPFVGQSDQFNVQYRKVLIDKSILILQRKPLFGVFDAREEPEMADMVQGEGIVDIVNAYLNIGLSYGLVGLGIFIWILLWTIYRIIKGLKYIRDKESHRYKLGKSLLAIYIGLFLMFTSTSISGISGNVVFLLLGLSASYSIIITNEFRERIRNSDK